MNAMHGFPLTKRVAAIHDLSCFGRAALTVVMPVLSAMGIQVCPLPTALYSTHGLFPGCASYDLTEQVQQIIRHWKELGLTFDAIYSGFLNSPRQIDIFVEFILDFRQSGQLVLIDPVPGDHGRVYGVTGQAMIQPMKAYITQADVITPNVTEAALLLDEPYRETMSRSEAHEWLKRLAEMGPDVVILTSVSLGETAKNQIGVLAYDRNKNQFLECFAERLPRQYPGTGDLFTSLVLGSLLQKKPLPQALKAAMCFIARSMALSNAHSASERDGILLEGLLHNLG